MSTSSLISGRSFLNNKGSIHIGQNCKLSGKRSLIGFNEPIALITTSTGSIRIGNKVGISNTYIYCRKN